MADMWISAFKVMAKSAWTDEFKKEIGEAVLINLHRKWHKNQSEFKDIDISEKPIEYLLEPNTNVNTTITVNTN